MSIGATRVEPGDPQPIEKILAAADSAMYDAKRSGRMDARVRL